MGRVRTALALVLWRGASTQLAIGSHGHRYEYAASCSSFMYPLCSAPLYRLLVCGMPDVRAPTWEHPHGSVGVCEERGRRGKSGFAWTVPPRRLSRQAWLLHHAPGPPPFLPSFPVLSFLPSLALPPFPPSPHPLPFLALFLFTFYSSLIDTRLSSSPLS